MNLNELTVEEKRVIIDKGTERPFSGKYYDFYEKGIYQCKQCGAELYHSDAKFDSGCGWPSFDDEIPGAITKVLDKDGIRTEILCSNCGAHLGHVFYGEGFTEKNTRHCVNSISMNFIPEKQLETAIFASGCFWGVQYHFDKIDGVISTEVGYTGGTVKNPTYREVSSGQTGHAEAVKVVFDAKKVNYEHLVRLFFETHDFTQINRQGPDIGTQYRSEIFYTNDTQKSIAMKYVNILNQMNYPVATKVSKASDFFKAEDYHQHYYKKSGGSPYCHIYEKIFED